MRVRHIMTRRVITITPEAPIVEAANIMMRYRVCGLPVVDTSGMLAGIVSEGDLLRESTMGTERRRRRWFCSILEPGSAAGDFFRVPGRKVSEIMTPRPFTVTEDAPLADVAHLMNNKHLKRLPVMRGQKIVGIVTRANILQAIATLGRHVPNPTADDDNIRSRIFQTIAKQDWCPLGLNVIVRDGIVHLNGLLIDAQGRQTTIVAAENVEGVVKVHDHLRQLEPISGLSVASPEDEKYAEEGQSAQSPRHALPFH